MVRFSSHNFTLYGLAILFLISAGGGFYFYTKYSGEVREREKLESELSESKNTVDQLEETILNLENDKELLTEALDRAENKNSEFEEQINELAQTVGVIEKWTKTDPELLQKYSKVYFLNEHYTPSRLVQIGDEYLYNDERNFEIHAQVYPYLRSLLEDATDEGIDLQIISAYRSFGTQASLKSHYTVTYGEGTANQFSADQGYSEHQLGTTADFTNSSVGGSFSGFGDTESFRWLERNAHRYGFTLSYPDGNAFYQYEPWHWRFVGVELATELYESDRHFYDLDQREIDPYLINLFD